MNWKNRMEMCIRIVEDMKTVIPEDCEDDINYMNVIASGIRDFMSSDEFLGHNEKEKELDSWNVFLNTISKCNESVELIADSLFPFSPKYVTMDEAYGKLLDEYSVDENDTAISSMNINDWMEMKKYVISDDVKKPLSDDKSDNKSINSRTEF